MNELKRPDMFGNKVIKQIFAPNDDLVQFFFEFNSEQLPFQGKAQIVSFNLSEELLFVACFGSFFLVLNNKKEILDLLQFLQKNKIILTPVSKDDKNRLQTLVKEEKTVFYFFNEEKFLDIKERKKEIKTIYHSCIFSCSKKKFNANDKAILKTGICYLLQKALYPELFINLNILSINLKENLLTGKNIKNLTFINESDMLDRIFKEKFKQTPLKRYCSHDFITLRVIDSDIMAKNSYALNMNDCKVYYLKIINEIKYFRREKSFYENKKNNHSILRCVGFIEPSLTFVYNHSNLKDLNKLIPSLNDGQKIEVILNLITGVFCLHQNGYFHRDLKPNNILLNVNKFIPYTYDYIGEQSDIGQKNDSDWIIKNDIAIETDFDIENDYENCFLSGFHTLRRLDTAMTIDIGSFCYSSPELLCNKDPSFPSDVYSMSLIFIKILTNEDIPNVFDCFKYKNPRVKELIEKIKNKYGSFFSELIENCLEENPNERKTLKDIVIMMYDHLNSNSKHLFFDGSNLSCFNKSFLNYFKCLFQKLLSAPSQSIAAELVCFFPKTIEKSISKYGFQFLIFNPKYTEKKFYEIINNSNNHSVITLGLILNEKEKGNDLINMLIVCFEKNVVVVEKNYISTCLPKLTGKFATNTLVISNYHFEIMERLYPQEFKLFSLIKKTESFKDLKIEEKEKNIIIPIINLINYSYLQSNQKCKFNQKFLINLYDEQPCQKVLNLKDMRCYYQVDDEKTISNFLNIVPKFSEIFKYCQNLTITEIGYKKCLFFESLPTELSRKAELNCEAKILLLFKITYALETLCSNHFYLENFDFSKDIYYSDSHLTNLKIILYQHITNEDNISKENTFISDYLNYFESIFAVETKDKFLRLFFQFFSKLKEVTNNTLSNKAQFFANIKNQMYYFNIFNALNAKVANEEYNNIMTNISPTFSIDYLPEGLIPAEILSNNFTKTNFYQDIYFIVFKYLPITSTCREIINSLSKNSKKKLVVFFFIQFSFDQKYYIFYWEKNCIISYFISKEIMEMFINSTIICFNDKSKEEINNVNNSIFETNQKLCVKESIFSDVNNIIEAVNNNLLESKGRYAHLLSATLPPIIMYKMNRYYLPSDCFDDPSFLDFEYSFKRFNFSEFINIKPLGKGSFADVFLSFHIPSCCLFALKIYNYRYCNHYYNEIQFYKSLSKEEIKDNFILPAYGYIDEEKTKALITKFMSVDSLASLKRSEFHVKKYFSKNSVFENLDKFFIKKSILSNFGKGLNFLNNVKKIYHNDIKEDNILFDNNFVPYICDFGLYNHSDDSSRNEYSQIEMISI